MHDAFVSCAAVVALRSAARTAKHATLKMFGAAREPYSTASLARCFFRPFQTSL